MKNMQVVMWDLTKTGMEWLDNYAENVDLMEIVSINDEEDTIPLSVLSENNSWDYLLIFEIGIQPQIERLLDLYHIPPEKTIFPLSNQSLWDHRKAVCYMMNDKVQRLIEYQKNRIYNDYITLTVEGGVSYIGRSSDQCIMNHMYTHRENWAADDIRLFYNLSNQYYQFTEKQTLFLDIGANIGTTCIYFKKCIDPSVEILAFEPMPETFQMLNINILLNGLDAHAKLENIGLSDKEDQSTFYYSESNPGQSSFVNEDSSIKTISVSTIPLDIYLKKNRIDISRIKYIWVDVEGYEGAFLEGAKETLKIAHIPVVMEVSPFLLQKQGRYESFLHDLAELYHGYIEMNDQSQTIHPIAELEKYADKASPFQTDIFLIKS